MLTPAFFAHDESRPKTFDVICAGEALWKIDAGAAALSAGGGVVSVALRLARQGLRVGVAAVLGDDRGGRAARERLVAEGVDVSGVTLASPRVGLVVVDARGGAADARDGEIDDGVLAEIPRAWSSEMLLLSGLSPVASRAAALCKAARRARRHGALVVLDANASLRTWAGQDARRIRTVLHEVDVLRCSVADLAVLGMDASAVRAELRAGAVLVAGDAARAGAWVATGPFGEVACAPSPRGGDAFTAALCAELLKSGAPGESAAARWHRALRGVTE